MKQLKIIFLLFIFVPKIQGQLKTNLIFDTTNNGKQIKNHSYYSKTDFSFVDSLELWNYKLDTTFKKQERDSIKPFAHLIFWRTRPIEDKINQNLYDKYWTPYIVFEIYGLTDSVFCYDKSNRCRFLSSCVPPNIGGDIIIIIGNFIFINSYVCISCERHDTKVDYCRPVINYIFSKVDKSKITTLHSLLQQLIIKEGKFEQNTNRQPINNN